MQRKRPGGPFLKPTKWLSMDIRIKGTFNFISYAFLKCLKFLFLAMREH